MGFVVPSRFCGPPESGNGGLGQRSRRRAAAARVRDEPSRCGCARPPRSTATDDRRDGIGRRRRRSRSVTASTSCRRRGAAPGWTQAAYRAGVVRRRPRRRARRYEGLADHPFPTCFSCGTGRDGRRRAAAPAGPRRRRRRWYAAAWAPPRTSTVETVWAALDCPGGWASGHRRPADGARHDDRPGRGAARRRRGARGDGLAARRRGPQAPQRDGPVCRGRPPARPGRGDVDRRRPHRSSTRLRPDDRRHSHEPSSQS